MKCSFLIVCLVTITACRPPQVVYQSVEVEKVVTIRDTVRVAAPVPATDNVAVEVFPWESPVDSFFVEDSTSFAEVVMRQDTATKTRRYTVRHGRKADTIYIEQPVVLFDTIKIKADCPPTLPAMPTDGKFPWWWLLAAFGAISVWWVGKRKK